MRLLVTTGIFPPDIGGPATYVPVIAEALMSRGLSVTILTVSPEGIHDDAGYPFPVVRIRRRSWVVRRAAQVVSRIAALARHHDLVFAPGLPVEAAVAATVVGKPYVLKVVGDLAWERAMVRGRTSDGIDTFQLRRYGLSTEFHRWAQTWAARGAARVIVPSAYLQRIVRGWGVTEGRIEVIPNAAPRMPKLAPETRLDGHTAEGKPRRFRIVTVARLVPWKGIEQLIRGLAAMEDVELLVVGDGPDRSRLEAVARAVKCRARFLGQVPGEEVLAILGTADLLILNSAYEGHSHVILEAMASGVPVIARAAGGTPEMVRHGETGLLLQAGTEAEVAAVVREVLEDRELRERLGRAGLASIAPFSLEDVVGRTWQVLEGVLTGSRGGRPSGDQHGAREPHLVGNQSAGPKL